MASKENRILRPTHRRHELTVTVPSGTQDAKIICDYIKIIYDVEAEITPQDKSKIKFFSGSSKDLLHAQNLALRFIGPESSVTVEMHQDLQLYTLATVRRYLATHCQIIVTVCGCSILVLRGPSYAVSAMRTTLYKPKSSTLPMDACRLSKLEKICEKLGIDFGELKSFNLMHLSLFFDVLVAVENSKMQAQCAKTPTLNSNSPQINGFYEHPNYIEVFRRKRSPSNARMSPLPAQATPKPQSAAGAAASVPTCISYDGDQPISVYKAPSAVVAAAAAAAVLNEASSASKKNVARLRHIVIDGANVGRGDSSTKQFCVNNLRLALAYFLERGHTEISIFLGANWQTLCEAGFSAAEITKYFTFMPFKRLKNGVAPQICDDDSVILEFARQKNAVVISNDQYRNWLPVRPEFRNLIENGVIPFTVRQGVFVLSHFPLGKLKPPFHELLALPD